MLVLELIEWVAGLAELKSREIFCLHGDQQQWDSAMQFSMCISSDRSWLYILFLIPVSLHELLIQLSPSNYIPYTSQF